MSRIQQAAEILRSGDKEKRRKAVMWLAKTKDAEAYPVLERASREDPDLEIRSLAKKGASYIELHADVPVAAAPVAEVDYEEDVYDDSYGLYDDEDDFATPYAEAAPVVSEKDAERAEELVKQAVDRHLSNDDKNALKKLAQAIDLDPSVKTEAQAMAIASVMTGLSGEAAMEALSDPIERDMYISGVGGGGTGKAKRATSAAPASWGDVWLDLGIYTVVNITGAIILVLLGTARFLPLLEEIHVMPEYQQSLIESGEEDVVGLLLDLTEEGIAVLLIIVVIGLLWDAALTLGQGYAYHFSAAKMLEGEGEATQSLRAAINPQTIYALIIYVCAIGFLLMLPNTIQGFEQSLGGWVIVGAVAVIVFFVSSIALPFVLASRLAKAQGFGMGKGCLSIIVGGIMFSILSSVLNGVLQAVIGVATAF